MNLFLRVILCGSLLLHLGAWAQGWPERLVKLVVPFATGAMGDTVARLLAERPTWAVVAATGVSPE